MSRNIIFVLMYHRHKLSEIFFVSYIAKVFYMITNFI
jgi:hypothetical protein